MTTDLTNVPAETARHVLAHFGRPGGHQAGRFTTLLIQTIDAADHTNEQILAEVYPGVVAAVHAAKYHPDGITALQHIAGSDR